MCLAPQHLPDGTKVRCRECWQCNEARVDGWFGRCIAESRRSVVSASVTLTYGRDEYGNESHARASLLTYSDVQKYVKQLRKRGLKFRYLVCGEVGSKKGRTHWHILLFFQEKLPDGFWDYGQNSWHRAKRKKREAVWVPLVWNQRFNEPCWPHGFSHWQTMHFGYEKGGVRYACKYINKDVDDPEAQTKLCMSKNPPIGAVYFDELAMRLVEHGLAPQDEYYQFPNQARRKNGTVIRFQLTGNSSDRFRENYILNWRGLPKPWNRQGPPVFTGRPWDYPHSEYVQDFEDRMWAPILEQMRIEDQFKEAKKWRGVEMTEEQRRVQYLTRLGYPEARWPKMRVALYAQTPKFVIWDPRSRNLGRWKKAKLQPSSSNALWLQSQISSPLRQSGGT